MDRELLLKASIQNPTDRQERIKPWTEDKDCCAQLAQGDFSLKDLRRGLPTSTAATLSSDLAEVAGFSSHGQFVRSSLVCHTDVSFTVAKWKAPTEVQYRVC